MDKLLSDSARTEISNKVMDILRAYCISNWHSEPYHQTEWRYRTIVSWTHTILNMSGVLVTLHYLCVLILNHIACAALGGSIPLLILYGIAPDISVKL